MVRICWNSLRVEPVVDHGKERGTTWIELFAFFAINGGIALVQPKARNHLRVKFLDEFARFKALSRALFKFATDDSNSMLQPTLQRAILAHAAS